MDRFGERLRLGTRAAFSACLLLLAACAVAARASDIDDTTAAAASASGAAAGDNGAQSAARSRPRLQLNQDSFFVEAVLLGFIAVYAFNVVRGLRANKRIGTAFAAKFTGEGSLLASQFSIVGQGEASAPDALQAESPSDYSVYATGRRYVSGLQIKLALKRRPDLLSYIWGMFVAQRDVGEISIYMNAPSWPPMTIAVGHAKPMKALTDAAKDVEKYASAPMGIAKERLPGWPTKAPALVAAAECSAVFYEIFGDAKMQALFSEAGLQGPLRHLRTLSISSDSEEGPQPRVIRCSFLLPPPEALEEVAQLLTALLYLADLLGSWAPSAEVRKRAAEARAKAEAAVARKSRGERDEEAAKKAEEKLQEKLAAMSPAERAKWKARQEDKQKKKMLKFKFK